MSVSPAILLAGGGTAGHVNPLLAMARELDKRQWKVHILGTKEGKEKELVPAAGFELIEIPRLPLPRRPSPDLLKLPFRMKQTVKQLENLLKKERIRLVLGFGGYVSTPLYLAARRAGVPVMIHEQNARPGLANRLGARWACAVALTFSNTPLHARGHHPKFPAPITSVTGLPLRPEIAQLATDHLNEEKSQKRRVQAAERFGLDPQRTTLLITGGSLGAQHINQVMIQAAEGLPEQVQVLHLTGKGKDEPVRTAINQMGLGKRWKVLDYLVEMEVALSLADLVVCRSGAGTVAELAAVGLPAVFIPFPIGNGEQKLNANDMLKSHAARLVENKNFTADYVQNMVWPLLNDPAELEKMSRAARQCVKTTAVEEIMKMIENIALS